MTPRRELATRQARWAKALAESLGRAGIRPNSVSIAGAVFALGAAAAFAAAGHAANPARWAWLIAAACGIQLRLLCNLLDGMIAIEGGFQTRTGALFNEIPDRIADVVILAGAGYGIPEVPYGVALGWMAAVLAVFTAYVRLLGGSLGLKEYFIGPMAKQHRMFTMTVAALAAAAEAYADWPERAIRAGLVLVVLGAMVTAIRRIGRLAADLQAR